MKLLLLDADAAICHAWRATFAGVEAVHIRNGRFESLPSAFDCLVSPANSFGLMDGGMDAAIIDYFGLALEERVQQEIWRRHRGEQPVGTCILVPTEDPSCPWLAHCPTMRVPMNVSWSNHAYAALLAALVSAEAGGVQVLACPGLGTGVGQMPPDVAARQMRYAFDIWKGSFIRPNWDIPWDREWRSYGRPRSDFLKHRLKDHAE
jgi:O-acetyl-ADP-ribose deacetylase (regulator of RNase III)